MPTYTFCCYEDKGGCNQIFEITATIAEYDTLKPKCPSCKKIKPIGRCYDIDIHYPTNSTPQTLGALADKNTTKYSDERLKEIRDKNTEYRRQPFTGKLPEGASLPLLDKDGRKIPSNVHRKKDPRRR